MGPTVSFAEASTFNAPLGAGPDDPAGTDDELGELGVAAGALRGPAATSAAGSLVGRGTGEKAGDEPVGRVPPAACPVDGANSRAGTGCSDAAFRSGASAFSTCLGAGTASTRRSAVATPSLLVPTCFSKKAPPSTTAAIAKNRRPRGRERLSTMAPGGTDSELGFCAGVSSLLAWRREPAGAAEVRESRARVAPASPLDAAPAGGAMELRAATSAGLSRPVCVTVRDGTGAGDALGRDGVLLRPRRECGRGDALGVDRRLGGALVLASPGATLVRSDRPPGGGTELMEAAF
jgi:hypothetical protein